MKTFLFLIALSTGQAYAAQESKFDKPVIIFLDGSSDVRIIDQKKSSVFLKPELNLSEVASVDKRDEILRSSGLSGNDLLKFDQFEKDLLLLRAKTQSTKSLQHKYQFLNSKKIAELSRLAKLNQAENL